MVSAASKLVAFVALATGSSRVHATSITLNPEMPVGDVAILDDRHPAFGGIPSKEMVQPIVKEDVAVARSTILAEVGNAPAATVGAPSNETLVRKLEITRQTNVDIERLDKHFNEKMVVNLHELNKYKSKAFEPIPWPSSYWPIYQDGINARWNQSEPSPAEKYARAMGLDVGKFMDQVSASNGIDSMYNYKKCRQESDCADRRDGSKCGIREGRNEGRCIPTWVGICHAWAPAAIMEEEPRCDVVKNNIRFHPFDIKALLTLLYDGARLPTVFTGARFDDDYGIGDKVDEYGRFKDEARRDLGPGYFHIAVTNILGKFGKSFVLDIDAGVEVWNHPVRSYEIKRMVKMKPSAAAKQFFNVPKYPFNREAKSVAYVQMYLEWIVEGYEDGPLVSTGKVNGYTRHFTYEYVLELDGEDNIIGGEWVGQSQRNHPDFLWFSTQKPSMDTVHRKVPELKYREIIELVTASVKCESPSPSPTTPSPTTPEPTSPTPTSPSPTTPSPTTPTPTSPVSGGPCGNDNDGPLTCPNGEYCQPWNPSFYQCRRLDAKCGKQEVGVDFYGEDIEAVSAHLPEECCAQCHATDGCKAYTFINYNADGNPRCYLKRGGSDKRQLVGAISAIIQGDSCDVPSGGNCGNEQSGAKCCPSGEYCQPWNPWQYQCRRAAGQCAAPEVGVDYHGEDLYSEEGLLPEQCCDRCAETAGCKAYTFVNYNSNGKSACYLKTAVGEKRRVAGAVSATVVNPKNGRCAQIGNTDFYGEDLSAHAGLSPAQCCDKCASTDGCRAYTNAWGVCYLKSGRSGRKSVQGAVSGILL